MYQIGCDFHISDAKITWRSKQKTTGLKLRGSVRPRSHGKSYKHGVQKESLVWKLRSAACKYSNKFFNLNSRTSAWWPSKEKKGLTCRCSAAYSRKTPIKWMQLSENFQYVLSAKLKSHTEWEKGASLHDTTTGKERRGFITPQRFHFYEEECCVWMTRVADHSSNTYRLCRYSRVQHQWYTNKEILGKCICQANTI